MSHSNRSGMGAIPFSDEEQSGVTFRVWAPFAEQVEVLGDFNNWRPSAPHALVDEGDGVWSKDIPEAQIGNQYKFRITNRDSKEVMIKTDPRGKKIHDETNWNSEVVEDAFDWGTDDFVMDPWNELVVYELHVASFNRSETEPGDFVQLMEKLGHIEELGFNAILLLPIFGFKGANSWGYNPAFPYDIESAYGGPLIFKEFVKEAHRRGIAIILDVVFNHFGSEELDQSLRRFDGWRMHDAHDGIYFYHDWKMNTAFGPRPDFGRGQVRSYIRDNAIMWLDEYRVDGLRFDSTVNIRNAHGNEGSFGAIGEGWSLMQWINSEIKRHAPWKISVAEDLQTNEWITKETGEGGAGFDSQWNSFFFHMIDRNIIEPNDANRNMFQIRDALTFQHGQDMTRNMIYVNNHDECGTMFDRRKYRLNERIWFGNADSWHARKRTTLAAAILFTAPGIPMIFQGDEFYEWGSWRDTVEIDWDKKERFAGIVRLHQDLVALRRNLDGTTKGLTGSNIRVFHLNHIDKLIGYHRWHTGGIGDEVIVLANFSANTFLNYRIGLPMSGLWKVRFNSDWNGYSPDFGNTASFDLQAEGFSYDGMPFSGTLGIGPYSLVILSR
ncbi:alpha-amylase family glycosyl hydrolase [Pontibacter sp. G13]|uniref:alpha-amylase family glycosyl hydrolase n=1 Tax=Pontibacter sp. G13 TaxID=3074898 RepID=UPI00288B5EA7|nr:alpha-amylase family glycosyl hydrolase [Pontibacter sp. G13]WNJ19479.1 alpha-amylase family glycosyl hydrolase [Pontibacter sp. G13]